MMSEISAGDWGSVASAIIAALALGFSVWSYRASKEAGVFAKQSADAAGKSAIEAEKAIKISQFEVLSPHFSNVEHLLKAFNGWEGTNGPKVAACGVSVQHLIDALHQDVEFQKSLLSLRKTLNIQPMKDLARTFVSDNERVSLASQSPGDLAEIMQVFDKKKKEYLGI